MKKLLITLLLTATLTPAFADNVKLKQELEKLGATDIEIKDSPIAGLKTAITNRGILYISDNGKYVLQGSLYQITDKGITDVSSKLLLDKLNGLAGEMIIFPAKQQKYVATVFLDTTCYYCHTLFEKRKEYNDLGITLRFLAFPRTGLDSQAAKQMEAIWTAKDPVFALTNAEDNGKLPTVLKNPDVVKRHYALGLQYGVRGTPTIVLDSGEVIGGYLPPKELLAAFQ